MRRMRTDTPQPIRLSDYRPPAFLIDEAHLVFDLKPVGSRVKARLAVRRVVCPVAWRRPSPAR